MKSYVCELCDYTYNPEKGDPERGVAPGTAFNDLPDDWTCPVCGAEKNEFQAVPETNL
ncbi:MAG: rubredoxin [Bacillota bacterium]